MSESKFNSVVIDSTHNRAEKCINKVKQYKAERLRVILKAQSKRKTQYK